MYKDTIKATVKARATQWHGYYTISGPHDAVQAEIDYLFAKFDPLGYGTCVESDAKDGDMRTAVVRRARTAD